ncbi:MAG: hypothetical protein A4E42_01372 [Methanoregulaceae archaeon PtaU1.Bin222]|nr:MAG: hypothetical protein A4E42_01372 [Methanoregulaceae archaeon PtaU1.Bin222]
MQSRIEKKEFPHSTIRFSEYRFSSARRNSSLMERPPFGQMPVHWEQKMHWPTQIRICFVPGMSSIAWAGQTFAQRPHPMQQSIL